VGLFVYPVAFVSLAARWHCLQPRGGSKYCSRCSQHHDPLRTAGSES